MSRSHGLIVALCLAALPAPSLATPVQFTVQALAQDCAADQGSADYGLCLGYLGGFGDALLVNRAARDDKAATDHPPATLAICPSGATPDYGTRATIFVNWEKQNPKKSGDAAYSGVLEALTAAWRC